MDFLTHFVSGLSLGSIYAIIALGYTMVYGIAKMLNFAHGDVLMIGSYITFVFMSQMGINPIVSVLLAAIACTFIGVIIERIAFQWLYRCLFKIKNLFVSVYSAERTLYDFI